MELRDLGNTGLKVTPLGFGAMELRESTMDAKQAAVLLGTALDNGINYIDTSPDYGPSEEYIGQALSHRRDQFYLATKCGCNLSGNGPNHIWSRQMLLTNLENSLKRLRTDTIDLWQLHGPTPEELLGGESGEVLQTMLELKQQGKVRHIGISFKNGSQNDPLYPAEYGFQSIQDFIHWNVFETMQIVYGGLTRKNETAITKAAEAGFGMIVRGVMKRYFDTYEIFIHQAKLIELCEPGETIDSFLIRFALSHSGIGTMIIGTRNPVHLVENIRSAAKGPLTPNLYDEAKRRLNMVGMIPKSMKE